MLRNDTKWRAARGTRAIKSIGEIEASIAALEAEDLLDLQDIFRTSKDSMLGRLATVEVERRGLVAQ